MEYIEPVAGAGDGGDALGVAVTGCGDGEESGIELASCGIVGAEEQGRGDQGVGVRRLAKLQGSPVAKPGETREVAAEKKV